MAVALDAGAAGGTTSSAASFSWAHTVAGSNRVLVVFYGGLTAVSSPTSITYASITLTQYGSSVDSSGATNNERLQIWTLVAPPVGTANVVVTYPLNSQGAGCSLSLTGVDQTTPLGTAVTSTGSSGTSGSVTVASATTGLVVSAVSAAATVAPTVTGTSQTLDGAGASGSGTPRYTAGSDQPGAASVTPSWSWNTSNGFVIAGVNVYAVGTAPSARRPATTVISGAVRRASVI